MPLHPIADVIANHIPFHVACNKRVLSEPRIPDGQTRITNRYVLETCIHHELLPALVEDDLPRIAESLAKTIQALIGTSLDYGIPLASVYAAVERTNAHYVHPETGRVATNLGTPIRPPGFVRVNVRAILRAFGWKPTAEYTERRTSIPGGTVAITERMMCPSCGCCPVWPAHPVCGACGNHSGL